VPGLPRIQNAEPSNQAPDGHLIPCVIGRFPTWGIPCRNLVVQL
jgi:hypothetical protein